MHRSVEAGAPVRSRPTLHVASETASRAADVTADANSTVKLVVAATSPKLNPNMPSSSTVPPVISASGFGKVSYISYGFLTRFASSTSRKLTPVSISALFLFCSKVIRHGSFVLFAPFGYVLLF